MVLLDGCWLVVALLWPVLPEDWIVLGFAACFVGKTLSAPCNSELCELLHPSAWHFLGWGHWRNVCLSLKHEKQSLLSSTNLALWLESFPWKLDTPIAGGYLCIQCTESKCLWKKMEFASLCPFVVSLMQTLLRLFWSLLLKWCSLQVWPWLRFLS